MRSVIDSMMSPEEHQAAMNAIALSFMAAIFELSASAGEAMAVINAQRDHRMPLPLPPSVGIAEKKGWRVKR